MSQEITEEEAALEARLEAARAARKALAESRRTGDLRRRAEAEERELEAERREVEAEEYEAKVEQAIADAEPKHGRLGVDIARVDCHAANGTIIGSVLVRRPSTPTWSRFQNTFPDAKGVKRDEALHKFWRPCLVWPSPEVVDALIDERPRFVTHICDELAVLAGAKVEEVSGKSQS